MSDKITSEEFVGLFITSAQNLITEQRTHIAAVEAERDTLAALVREVIDKTPGCQCDEITIYCAWCGESLWTGNHAPDCLITRARQALAALETK